MYQDEILEPEKLLSQWIAEPPDDSAVSNGPQSSSCELVYENQQDDANLHVFDDTQLLFDEENVQEAPVIGTIQETIPYSFCVLPHNLLMDEYGFKVQGYASNFLKQGQYEAVNEAQSIDMDYSFTQNATFVTKLQFEQILKCNSDGNKLVVFYPEHPLPIGRKYTCDKFLTIDASVDENHVAVNGNHDNSLNENHDNSTPMVIPSASEEVQWMMDQETRAQPSTSAGTSKRRMDKTSGKSGSPTKKRRASDYALLKVRRYIDKQLANEHKEDKNGSDQESDLEESDSNGDATTDEDSDVGEVVSLKVRPKLPLSNLEEAIVLEKYIDGNKERQKWLFQEIIKEKLETPNKVAGSILNRTLMTPTFRCDFNWAGQADNDKKGLHVELPQITKVITDAVRFGPKPKKLSNENAEEIIKDKLKQQLSQKQIQQAQKEEEALKQQTSKGMEKVKQLPQKKKNKNSIAKY